MKFLALTLYLLARITLNFKQQRITLNFQGFNLVILNFELPFAFLYTSYELFEKWVVLCRNNSVLMKIRDTLIFVTNCCTKVTGKLTLPSVSRFNFSPPDKNRKK